MFITILQISQEVFSSCILFTKKTSGTEKEKHTCTIFTSCIASLTDLDDVRLGTSIAGASATIEFNLACTEPFRFTEYSDEVDPFLFR